MHLANAQSIQTMASNSTKKYYPKNCFVPDCKTNNVYRDNKPIHTLFRPPDDEVLLKKWSLLIRRADKELNDRCAVCELHFEEQYIERYYRHIVKEKLVLIPRYRPFLKPDALPTIFPNRDPYTSMLSPNRNISSKKKMKLSSNDD